MAIFNSYVKLPEGILKLGTTTCRRDWCVTVCRYRQKAHNFWEMWGNGVERTLSVGCLLRGLDAQLPWKSLTILLRCVGYDGISSCFRPVGIGDTCTVRQKPFWLQVVVLVLLVLLKTLRHIETQIGWSILKGLKWKPWICKDGYHQTSSSFDPKA